MGLVKFLDNQYSFENRIIVYDFKYSVGGRVEMRLFEEILLSWNQLGWRKYNGLFDHWKWGKKKGLAISNFKYPSH